MSYEKPYEGLRVVDLSQGIAGPYCGMLLAQYGADVIKVEPFEGDWSRILGVTYGDHSAFSIAGNLGKRSIALDLKSEGGREIVNKLIEEAAATSDFSLRAEMYTEVDSIVNDECVFIYHHTVPLTGASVTHLTRRAKYGLIHTSRDHAMVFHLGMSGRWRIDPEVDEKHDHLVIEIDRGERIARVLRPEIGPVGRIGDDLLREVGEPRAGSLGDGRARQYSDDIARSQRVEGRVGAIVREGGRDRSGARLEEGSEKKDRVGHIDDAVVVRVRGVFAVERCRSGVEKHAEDRDGIADIDAAATIDIAADEPGGGRCESEKQDDGE